MFCKNILAHTPLYYRSNITDFSPIAPTKFSLNSHPGDDPTSHQQNICMIFVGDRITGSSSCDLRDFVPSLPELVRTGDRTLYPDFSNISTF